MSTNLSLDLGNWFHAAFLFAILKDNIELLWLNLQNTFY